MASVNVFTAERMQEIEDTTIVGGLVDVDGKLLLEPRVGPPIDAGFVKGEQGDPGDPGADGSSALPIGTISMWASDTPPTNWLICDGSAISRTTYATLFAFVGTKYGVGDGVNTFNLPNLKGRVPVGKDSAQTEFDNLGETGGAKTHTLTEAEMPAHDHNGVSAVGNSMFYRLVQTVGASKNGNHAVGYGTGTYVDYTDANYPTAFHTHNIPSDGGGGAHNNTQPYQVVNFIIKFSSGAETPGDDLVSDRLSALETGGTTPAGTISMYSGDTPPSNWLLCDGAAISRTTYAALFDAIGIKYGAGNGTTTFNVPNLKGRVPVGKDSAQTEFDNLGETGGAKSQTQSHSHPLSAAGHALIAIAARAADQILMRRIATTASYSPTHSIDLTGGGAAGYSTSENAGAELDGVTDDTSITTSTLQPYQVVNFIIKTTSGEQANDSQLSLRVATLESQVSDSVLALRDRMQRLQHSLNGGGVRRVTSTGIGWSERLIVVGHGWEAPALNGYWDITMPPNGTVIPVYGHSSVTSVTVASGEIPITSWGALYYELPLDAGSTTDSARYRFISHSALLTFTPPPNWILVAVRNSDITNHAAVKWGDGRSQDYWRAFTLGQSWVDFGTEYTGHQWKFADDGSIRLRGLIKSGLFSTSVAVASWGATRAPEGTEIFSCISNNAGSARIDVKGTTGDLIMYAAYNTGSNAWVSLAGISWFPKDTV